MKKPAVILGAIVTLLVLVAHSRTHADEPTGEANWQSLFDGKSLGVWKVVDEVVFKKHGEVTAADGQITLAAGSPGTGIRYEGEDLLRSNYELTLQASRLEGDDFFCGLTFPVGEAPCTWIVGGWGGGVVGLSNVDGMSAVENETTGFVEVKNGEWYQLRLRVTDDRIAAWIDDKQVVNLAIKDRKFNVWLEQEPMVPLGIATWNTKAAVKDLRIRKLEEAELADDAKQ